MSEQLINFEAEAKSGNVVVLASNGVWTMKPAEFCDFDENCQVEYGEANKRFEIYVVFFLDMRFAWAEAQKYFKRCEP